ncbi:sensor histidine kinase [Bailinhaonella thermotolerans]|uniref:histidine kinase n=1 Tax=Bailinhaonella thermotolerans TaxID=1070861 RepID=A0A3A4BXB2_9ACTN|nr:sensor histidine kinase [Bailinhaonella thermotolerans]
MLDACLGAVVSLVVAVAITADVGGERGPDLGAYLFAAGLGLLMLVRRQHPVLALVATTVGLCGYYIADYPPIGLAVPVAAALYSAAEHGRPVLATAVAAFLLVASSFFRLREGEQLAYLLGYELPWSVAIMAGAVALGDGVRSRRIRNEQQRERERDLLEASRREAARRIEEERLGLARDLHDVLAHTTTIITLQADVAREALDDHDVAAARAALEVIRTAGGQATGELRSTLALLRRPAEETPRAPTGGLEHLGRLAAATTAGGLPAAVHVHGEPAPVPTVVGVTAYRIAQEALTNAVRHAAGATRVDVHVTYRPESVEISVRDDGRGTAGDGHGDGRGHGLTGMRERAELIGGTLTTRTSATGFEVSATLPLRGSPEPGRA